MCRATRRMNQGTVMAVWGTWVKAGRPQKMLSKPCAGKGLGKAPQRAGAGLTSRYGGQEADGVEGKGKEVHVTRPGRAGMGAGSGG